MQNTNKEWQRCDAQTFWDKVAAADHLVQIYDSEEVLISSLTGFVTSGLNSGESVILVATPEHLNSITNKLFVAGYDLERLTSENLFIPVNAHTALGSFMRVGWPNKHQFVETVEELLDRARGQNNRKVRAYGEMVAILWAQGFSGATVQLEHLWNEFCKKEDLCIYCAYPKSGFTQDVHKSIGHICSTHSKIISGEHPGEKRVYYKNAV